MLAFWFFGGSKSVRIPLDPNHTVPAAGGSVLAQQTHNGNTRIDLTVHNLAQPVELTPSATHYVVWVQANGYPPEDVGTLKVNNSLHGKLKADTPFKDFTIFITAEQSTQPRSPSGERVLSGVVNRGTKG